MEQFINELQAKIIKTLDLDDISSAPWDINGPLIGGPLGLDSIDILEMVIMIEKDYGVRIDNRELGEKVFVSLKTLAAYIHDHSPSLKE
jgi:acyl carrier protein